MAQHVEDELGVNALVDKQRWGGHVWKYALISIILNIYAAVMWSMGYANSRWDIRRERKEHII